MHLINVQSLLVWFQNLYCFITYLPPPCTKTKTLSIKKGGSLPEPWRARESYTHQNSQTHNNAPPVQRKISTVLQLQFVMQKLTNGRKPKSSGQKEVAKLRFLQHAVSKCLRHGEKSEHRHKNSLYTLCARPPQIRLYIYSSIHGIVLMALCTYEFWHELPDWQSYMFQWSLPDPFPIYDLLL